MGRACGTLMREVHTKFLYKNLKKRDHYEDQDTEGKIILKWFLKK
jgi:hypothetical protein